MLVPVTKDATSSCVSMQDPAINRDAIVRETLPDGTSAASYIRERYKNPSSWRELVPMLEGATPTVFVIGVIPPSELNRIEDECGNADGTRNANELGWRCFLHGVRKIDGLELSIVTKQVGGVEYVDPQWLADVFNGYLRNVAIEIGTIVWAWNQLAPEDSANLSGRSKHTTASSA